MARQKTKVLLNLRRMILGRDGSRVQRALPRFGVALAAMVIVVLRWYLIDAPASFVTGQPAKVAYFAQNDLVYTDHDGTAKMRDQVQQNILGVLVRGKASSPWGFQEAYNVLLNSPLEDQLLDPQLRQLLDQMPLNRREELLSTVQAIQEDLSRSLSLTPEQKDELIWSRIELLEPDPAAANLAFQLLLALTESTEMVDAEITQRIRAMAAADLAPLRKVIYAGERILDRGEIVTPQIAKILKEEGYPEGRFPLGILCFAAVTGLVAMVWIQKTVYHPLIAQGWHQGHGRYLFFLLCLGWLLQLGTLYYGAPGMGVLPLAAVAYLTLPELIAFHFILALSFSGAIITWGYATSSLAISALSGCLAALMGMSLFQRCNSRSRIWWSVVMLGLSMVALSALIRWGFRSQFPWTSLVAMLLSCLILAVAVIVGMPLLEMVFDIVSPLQLVELTHPSYPLLKRLQVEAPGTYHHVQMVGNLAEAAAERLGLNPMLLRAGACFHDIGKLKRPQSFVENQLTGVNSHDKLSPTMSALIILAHVKDGLELADQYRLPTQIKNFIAEHHGTTCLSYFYRKALQAGLNPLESQFCYPGPKPQSRETGLLMIADSVEAAARAEGRSFKGVADIQRLVDSVVQSKINAGQFDDVPFSLRDLSEIKESMCTTLRSMYHTRDIKPLASSPSKSSEGETQVEKG